jgi:hypothetical protein
MAGTSSAMTKSESFSISWKKPENADCFFGQALRSGSFAARLEPWGGWMHDADSTQPETSSTAKKQDPEVLFLII